MMGWRSSGKFCTPPAKMEIKITGVGTGWVIIRKIIPNPPYVLIVKVGVGAPRPKMHFSCFSQ